ncbi:hypothetical protein MuYL_1384 [Mucilaginibacter xinganensis]|uniref:Uncharacterized protein n=1 Tax=Mucilaginibacter xinganensis TaxID=1234841 RepID=A0A223NTS8_9SPHI|nr:hypothetical protein MuYL_1384 [Mucilaginibacter xinganensis]
MAILTNQSDPYIPLYRLLKAAADIIMHFIFKKTHCNTHPPANKSYLFTGV